MTLLTIFRRKARDRQELVLASDSRLSGGQSLDYAQKIFQLPRSDVLFAFAGETRYAYPLLMQMQRAIEGYPNSRDRRLPLANLKGHTLRVFQQTYEAIHSLPVGQQTPDSPDNFFLLGGYDWHLADFVAWRLTFDSARQSFVYRKILGTRNYPYFFSGDNADAVKQAHRRTTQLLSSRGKTAAEIDMEPFEVLAETIAAGQFPSIGGAAQLGKVYASLSTRLFQVLWPTASGTSAFHVAGRPLLPYEKCDFPKFDPTVGFYWTDPSKDELINSVPLTAIWRLPRGCRRTKQSPAALVAGDATRLTSMR